ncbi:MAG: hypothetical protein JWM57_2240 [Phycisphaerales bacterium]|nr:hypothetical protein [Phycisphaerales bacterium]
MVDFTRRSRLVSRAMLAASAALVLSSSVYAQQAPDTGMGPEKKDTQVTPPAPVAPQPDDRVGSKLSYSAGVDATSHFISFGGDVWGGGNEASPFSSRSTTFVYGTVSAKFTDELSGYVNLWSDNNDNVDSNIGGPIQEIDFNVGLNYTWDKFTFGIAHAYWMFGGGAEKAVEVSAAYNDADMWENTLKGFALNPSFLAHYRYDSTGDLGGANACVLQVGIKPTYTFDSIDDYPITVSVPMNVAYFTDPYQGGDGAGFGYFNAGVSASVPLAFIPKGFGAWTASVSEIYYNTTSDIPNNPEDNFFVTTLSVGVSF